MSDSSSETNAPKWLHRLSVLAVCLVWPLIWVGGLVTTYDAGMAVPDWPNTYGDNLFLYPISTWLSGPFDLFIEHGHRLLGAVVGVVAIAMVVAAFLAEQRGWVRLLAVAILLAVISQGVLGGIRVVLGDRTVAMIHGCFGPLVFALCAIAMVVTQKSWWDRKLKSGLTVKEVLRPGKLALSLATISLGLSYTQLVFGAQLRHVAPTTSPGFFTMMVAMHVMTAFLLWGVAKFLVLQLRRCGDLTLSRSAIWLLAFLTVQILLGVGTWVVNYGWPSFLQWFPGSTGFLVRAKGFVDSIVVTAHVAVGSLILANAAIVFVQTLRRRHLSLADTESLTEKNPNVESDRKTAKTPDADNEISPSVTTA